MATLSQEYIDIIETAYEQRQNLSDALSPDLKKAVNDTIAALDSGTLRVAEKKGSEWYTHQWIKKAILLYFRLQQNQIIRSGELEFYDKIPVKFQDLTAETAQKAGVRVVPPACARFGAYIAENCVLMPSYVNIGAYVDSGTLVDTWATVGSCAQIGKNVHISGGVGIGGVLEPLQNNPCIIEDNCFIGARSEIVEGMIIEKGAVLSMGVFLGQSTRIYNRQTGEISYGRIPAGAVVVPGSLPAPDGSHSLYCAVIVKQVDEQTRAKVSINELLRA